MSIYYHAYSRGIDPLSMKLSGIQQRDGTSLENYDDSYEEFSLYRYSKESLTGTEVFSVVMVRPGRLEQLEWCWTSKARESAYRSY